MPDNIQLRRFQSSDVPQLVELFRETVHRVCSRDYTPEQIRAWAPDEVNLARWRTLAERYTIVAEVDDRIAGFTDLESDGHVDRFFVHADFQRMGVGRALLLGLVAEAKRLGFLRLYAEVSITARAFFERHGFEMLLEQTVVVREVELTNFRMERWLNP